MLPQLRQELELIQGGTSVGGSPSWLVHDPVRNQYFHLDWVSFEMLSCWGKVTPQELMDQVRDQGRVHVGEADLQYLLQFLGRNQLLQVGAGAFGQMARSRAQLAGTWWAWLLHNYLFFRLPLVRPDAFLHQTLRWTGFVFTRLFAGLTVLAGVLGLIGVSRQWDAFAHTLVDFFSWQGMLAYGLTLTFVKGLHELGHAYTAKRFGCQVPTMGLAFLVMWPVLYTDTNDVWRLKDHRQRLAVSSAGVLTELGVALWATFLWVLVPDGLPRSMLFLLSTTTWVSTLLINVSPFMRFDGYFIVMDWLQFPNLHGRSFALARWHLRKVLLGLNDPAPESFAPRQQALLIVFAWATWIYRLFLFLGIAVLVFQFFIKLVGILLFLVEIVWFVAKPLASELAVWGERWPDVKAGRRQGVVGVLVVLIALIGVVPLPGRVVASAVVVPQQLHAIYAPKGAMLLSDGQEAVRTKDQSIFVFDAPQLNSQNETNEARQASSQWVSGVATMNAEMLGQWESLTAQSGVARAEGQVIRSDLNNYRALAPFDGQLFLVDPDLRPGQWLMHAEKLGHLVGQQGVRVVAYVQDVDVKRLQVGQSAFFAPDSGVGPKLELVVDKIHSDRVRTLTDPELAANFGGSVLVREQRGQFFPEGAYYRVEFVSRSQNEEVDLKRFKWRGRVYVSSNAEPLLAPLFKTGVSVLIREAGF
ncbi:MAG: site-2 protease family protein [Limnohabitans sp.]